eukprot:1674950-Amphidinium_carterae.1
MQVVVGCLLQEWYSPHMQRHGPPGRALEKQTCYCDCGVNCDGMDAEDAAADEALKRFQAEL